MTIVLMTWADCAEPTASSVIRKPPLFVSVRAMDFIGETGVNAVFCAYGFDEAPAGWDLPYWFTDHPVDEWIVPDPALAFLTPLENQAGENCTIAVPLVPGDLRLEAVMQGVEGSGDPLKVVSAVAKVVVLPEELEVIAGTQAGVRAVFLTAAGDTLGDVPVHGRSTNYGVASAYNSDGWPDLRDTANVVVYADAPGTALIEIMLNSRRREDRGTPRDTLLVRVVAPSP